MQQTDVGTPSFYRRPLPTPPATAFSSADGRRLFREALSKGWMEGYFLLAEQFRTQDEPAFCGLSTLTMVLNALGVDPMRTWKGPWRWYHESMLDCCRPLESVEKSGLLFQEFVCLGDCHGLDLCPKHPQEPGTNGAGATIAGPAATDSCTAGTEKNLLKPCCAKDAVSLPAQESLADFRANVIAACSSPGLPMVVVSYSRKEFEQTGDGHFSPIAGYHKSTDGTEERVLILDTARFKYPPHWVPLSLLYSAMQRRDQSTGLMRGWVVVGSVKQVEPRCSPGRDAERRDDRVEADAQVDNGGMYNRMQRARSGADVLEKFLCRDKKQSSAAT